MKFNSQKALAFLLLITVFAGSLNIQAQYGQTEDNLSNIKNNAKSNLQNLSANTQETLGDWWNSLKNKGQEYLDKAKDYINNMNNKSSENNTSATSANKANNNIISSIESYLSKNNPKLATQLEQLKADFGKNSDKYLDKLKNIISQVQASNGQESTTPTA